jgi:alkylation response protein AidB-like acyl-CoA dehydrogenase
MDFRLTEEQRELAQLARRVAEGTADGPTDATAPEIDWTPLANTGLMGLLIGEADGGSGATLVEAAILAEELGRAGAPAAVVGSALIAAAALDLVPSPELRHELRQALAAGRPMSVMVGDDLAWPPVNQPVAWGWHVGCLALAPVEDGLGLVEIAGAEVRPTQDLGLFVARSTTNTAATAIEATESGQRFLAATNVILSSLLVGVMGRALDLAVEHAKNREQFGVKIGTFQAIKHLCADMFVDVESSRSAAYGAAAIVANASELGRAIHSAAVAKAWCGDAAVRVCEGSVQVHGGMGFTWECDVHRYLRTALVARASFMSSDRAVDVVAGRAA